MRRAVLILLALIGVGCALVVTASSTMRQAYAAAMPEPVPLFLVGLLEVVNVAGTWSWLSDQRPSVRVEAAVGVGLASTVTGACGALTYGPLGLVAPLGLLAAVHLLSRLLVAAPAETRPQNPQNPADTGGGAQHAPPAVGEAPTDPPTAPPAEAPMTRDGDEEIVAALVARPTLPGRDAVKAEFSVGTKRAERVLEVAAAHRRPRLVTAEEATS